jgi:hypothetical protein
VASLNAPWHDAKGWFTRKPGKVRRVGLTVRSPYAPNFTQGATFTPRFVFVVERREASALGVPAGRIAVQSSRSVQEKKPWKEMASLSGVIESEYVRTFFTGENVFPFRTGEAQLAVLPCGRNGLLDAAHVEMSPGLHQWWDRAQALWNENRRSDRLSLAERLDYQRTLSKQFPLPSLRVVYNRAGMHLAAAKVTDRRALIANGLYWASAASVEEADYLCAMINAPVTTELVRPYMSYGKDERDIHKHIWEVPIPLYSSEDASHRRIAELGRAAETILAKFPIDPDLHFAATRRHMREELEGRAEGRELNDLVFELIG